jgi:hypothetical protein
VIGLAFIADFFTVHLENRAQLRVVFAKQAPALKQMQG